LRTARLGDVAWSVGVERCAVVVEADLDRCRLVLQSLLDHTQHSVDVAVAVATDRSVERQRGPPRAADRLVNRQSGELALDVRQRDVERGQRTGQRPFGSQLDQRVHRLVERHGVVERVSSDQHRRDIMDDHTQ